MSRALIQLEVAICDISPILSPSGKSRQNSSPPRLPQRLQRLPRSLTIIMCPAPGITFALAPAMSFGQRLAADFSGVIMSRSPSTSGAGHVTPRGAGLGFADRRCRRRGRRRARPGAALLQQAFAAAEHPEARATGCRRASRRRRGPTGSTMSTRGVVAGLGAAASRSGMHRHLRRRRRRARCPRPDRDGARRRSSAISAPMLWPTIAALPPCRRDQPRGPIRERADVGRAAALASRRGRADRPRARRWP